MIKQHTLCIIHDTERILLGLKKRGFGAGKWNGFGGKVATGETLVDAARRELLEEVGTGTDTLQKAAVLDFVNENGSLVHETHVFRVARIKGDPIETAEMRPKWFLTNEIPYEEMWEGDRIWLPRFLEGRLLCGRFIFDGDDTLVSHELVACREGDLI